jgi:ABC-2 type transport system permease protein
MAAIWHIYRREVGTYFTTPMAYVVMTLFLIIVDVFFFNNVSEFVTRLQMQMGQVPPDFAFNANELIVRSLLFQMAVVLLFLAPMITMRLFAEENQLGTIEMLLTCPVRDIEVILAKYLAAMTVFVVLLGVTLVYPIFLAFQTRLEIGPILCGYFGLLLLASTFTAIGLFYSSLTENQIVAAALTFATLLFLWLLAALVESDMVAGGLSEFLREISIVLRFVDLSGGLIDLGDVVYYLTLTAFGLFLTVNVLDTRVH